MDRSNTEAWATVTPADLIRSITRRLPSVLATTLVVTALLAAVLFVWPNRYASDGLMYVRLGRGAVSLDPTTLPSKAISLQESRSAEVVSVSEMLNSREVAERTVEAVGVEEINRPRNWVDRTMLSLASLIPKNGSVSGMEPAQYAAQLAKEEAIKRVTKSLQVSIPKNGYTVAVAARQSDPVLAREIVQSVMNQYQDYHVEAHRSRGSLDFFEQQIAKSQQAAVDARRELQTARNELGWLSVESAETTLRERIVNLELALDDAESNLADSESLVLALGQRLEEVSEWIPMEITKGLANNAKDSMRTALYGEQMKKGEELARVTPNHPRYNRLKENLDQGHEIVQQEGTDREITREAINPVRQQLETQYQAAVAKSAGLKSRQQSLAASLQEAEGDLRRLNDDAITLSKLAWAADIAEKNYLEHAKSLEQARMVHELDNEKMSDVSVIQNASLNLKKVGPPRLLLLAMGSLLGLSLGLLQALLRETPVAIDTAATVSRPPSIKTNGVPVPPSQEPIPPSREENIEYLPAATSPISEPSLPPR